MVRGLARFREHFAGFEDHYVLIGGAACDLAMTEAGLDFRATKDLDIVLCVEVLDAAFVGAFWEFINHGGYRNRQKSTGKRLFYRFHDPEDYILSIVEFMGDNSHRVHHIRQPFKREPDFMVTSANYIPDELIQRANATS